MEFGMQRIVTPKAALPSLLLHLFSSIVGASARADDDQEPDDLDDEELEDKMATQTTQRKSRKPALNTGRQQRPLQPWQPVIAKCPAARIISRT
jgi:hypothetical protein